MNILRHQIYTSTEKKKIKTPAVPPKTYLGPKLDTNGEIETPSDEEAQSVDESLMVIMLILAVWVAIRCMI